jgi:hypothetical protein
VKDRNKINLASIVLDLMEPENLYRYFQGSRKVAGYPEDRAREHIYKPTEKIFIRMGFSDRRMILG